MFLACVRPREGCHRGTSLRLGPIQHNGCVAATPVTDLEDSVRRVFGGLYEEDELIGVVGAASTGRLATFLGGRAGSSRTWVRFGAGAPCRTASDQCWHHRAVLNDDHGSCLVRALRLQMSAPGGSAGINLQVSAVRRLMSWNCGVHDEALIASVSLYGRKRTSPVTWSFFLAKFPEFVARASG